MKLPGSDDDLMPAELRPSLPPSTLAAIFESSLEAVVVADPAGRIVELNPAAERIFRLRREEAVGRPVPEALLAAPFREEAARAFAATDGGPPLEATARRADGTEFPAEIRIAIAGEEPSLIAAFIRDLSREKRAEEELRLVTDAAPALISYVDREGRYVFVNRGYESWFGLSADAIKGRHLWEVLGTEAWERIRPNVERALRGERVDDETEIPYANGGTRFVRASYVPDAPSGEVRGLVVLVTDASEERRTRERERFLGEASALLASSLEVERTLETLAGLSVPRMADWCAVFLRESGTDGRLVALAHRDPVQVARVRELLDRLPADPRAPRGHRKVLRTGESEFFPEVPPSLLEQTATSPEHLDTLKSLALRSYMSVPIALRGEVIGAISFADCQAARRFTPADLAFAEELGRRAAYAIENARLYQTALESGRRARRHRAALLELARTLSDDLAATLRAITEKVSETLDVERVSVWRFSADRSEILCEDLYSRKNRAHETGLRIRSADHPRYFAALEESRAIAAADARTDARTSEFRPAYLEPLGIASMLDVPVRLRGGLAGIVCHEHTGGPREWTPEEEDFSASVADLVSVAFETAERRRAEEARSAALRELEQEHARLREISLRERARARELETLMDSVPAIVWVARDPYGRDIVGNRPSYELLRLPSGTNASVTAPVAAPTHFRVFEGERELPPEDLPIQRALRTGRDIRDYEEEIVFEDGVRVRLFGNVVVLKDTDGRTQGAVAAFVDVTERVRAEERFRLAIEAAPNGMLAVDDQARIVLANAQVERLFGYSREELAGHPADLLVPGCFRAGAASPAVPAGDLFGRRKDGSEFPVEIGLNPIRRREGTLVLASIVDITERKARERESRVLAEAGALLTHALDAERTVERIPALAVPDLADWCVIDLLQEDGRIRRAGFVHRDPDLAERARRRLPEHVSADGEPRGAARAIRLGSSEVYPVLEPATFQAVASDRPHEDLLSEMGARSAVVVPMRARGRVTGALLLVRGSGRAPFGPEDARVAEALADRAALALDNARLFRRLQQLNEDLERRVEARTAELRGALREIEAFAYTIAHDLRAPIRAMTGFSHVLLEDYGDRLDAGGLDYLRRIRDAGHRMDAMIRDLLQYSRITRGEVGLERVDLEWAVGRALAELAHDLEERRAKVEISRPLPVVRAHSLPLILALQNLISNAAKFVPAGTDPRIRIRAHALDGRIRLWVEDNGIGVAPEHRERIFGVFERLHGTDTYPGTGIGLAIVRKAMERMGGRAGVEGGSEPGSRFYLEFPPSDAGGPP